jgi:hypothetical protein
VVPTDDSFRALARSSPWRWSTLHLRRRHADGSDVEAWIRRPDWMLVRTDRGEYVQRAGARTVAILTASTDGGGAARTEVLPWGGSLTPTYRSDGLVAARPEGRVDYDDPMHQNYEWVAMLDPVELTAGVELADLRAEVRAGRETWWARARAVDGYDPRCSCCPLLWSPVSDELEYGEDGSPYSTDYPSGYDVALDVGTGVVVALRPDGGRADLGFDVDILDVDADLAELVAAHPR